MAVINCVKILFGLTNKCSSSMFAVSNVLACLQHKIYIRPKSSFGEGGKKTFLLFLPLGIIVNSEAQQEFPSKLNVNFKKYFYY